MEIWNFEVQQAEFGTFVFVVLLWRTTSQVRESIILFFLLFLIKDMIVACFGIAVVDTEKQIPSRCEVPSTFVVKHLHLHPEAQS